MSKKKQIKSWLLRGRLFCSKDIKLINSLVLKHYLKGRTFISRKVCESLDWRQPNGWLKDRACRDVLRTLHSKRLIRLPRSKAKRRSSKKIDNATSDIWEMKLIPPNLTSINFSKLSFQQVKGTSEEKLWNRIVNKYHYLGFKAFVGRSLKYLIFYDERVIAAIGFSDPAWQLKARDNLCLELGIDSSKVRWHGFNNGRFLILPWVKIPNLASYILSKSVKRALDDWERYYLVRPIYIETFVDPDKFYGTCYKADNWELIGKSKGYKKSGTQYSNSQVPKLIFIKFFENAAKKNAKVFSKTILK